MCIMLLLYYSNSSPYIAPGAPKDVQIVEPIRQREVEIQWSTPTDIPVPINGYNLTCIPSPSSLPAPSFSLPPVETYTLSGLTPSTEYKCSLSAYNDAGQGPTVTISFTTLPDSELKLDLWRSSFYTFIFQLVFYK